MHYGNTLGKSSRISYFDCCNFLHFLGSTVSNETKIVNDNEFVRTGRILARAFSEDLRGTLMNLMMSPQREVYHITWYL